MHQKVGERLEKQAEDILAGKLAKDFITIAFSLVRFI